MSSESGSESGSDYGMENATVAVSKKPASRRAPNTSGLNMPGALTEPAVPMPIAQRAPSIPFGLANLRNPFANRIIAASPPVAALASLNTGNANNRVDPVTGGGAVEVPEASPEAPREFVPPTKSTKKRKAKSTIGSSSKEGGTKKSRKRVTGGRFKVPELEDLAPRNDFPVYAHEYLPNPQFDPNRILAASPIGHPHTGTYPLNLYYPEPSRPSRAPVAGVRREASLSSDSEDEEQFNPVPRRRGRGVASTVRRRQVEQPRVPAARAHSPRMLSPRVLEQIRAINSKERPKPNAIAKARRITADLDDQDKLMVDLKKKGWSDKAIKQKLTGLGFPEYATRTISSRFKRCMIVLGKRQDEILDLGEAQWTEDDDQRLAKARADAEDELVNAHQKLEASRWSLVARNLNNTPGPCYSTKACRERSELLGASEISEEDAAGEMVEVKTEVVEDEEVENSDDWEDESDWEDEE